MSSRVTTVVIPEVELSLEQLVAAIRQLEPAARSEVVKALLETDPDMQMEALIQRLANRPPAEDITDADIVTEVNAVREQRRR